MSGVLRGAHYLHWLCFLGIKSTIFLQWYVLLGLPHGHLRKWLQLHCLLECRQLRDLLGGSQQLHFLLRWSLPLAARFRGMPVILPAQCYLCSD